jgi:hypothetical protein
MRSTDKGFLLESTGKEILTFSADGLSLSSDNHLQSGFDNGLCYYDQSKDEYLQDFTEEEKKEIAMYVISQWANFAGLKIQYL